jgi:MFS family permease
VITRYRALLSVKGLRRLLVSSILGRLPSGMFSLSILLLVKEQTGSFLTAGMAVGAFTLAGAATSPVQGMAVDRFGQTRVLLPTAIGQGLLLVAFLFFVRAGSSTVTILVLAVLAGAVLPPVSGCVRALWLEVAPDQQALETAYALDAITQEIIYTLGPLLAGTVAVLLSPSASLMMCAVITLSGTVLFSSSALSRGWQGGRRERSHGGALASFGIRILLLSALCGGFVVGAAEVGLPALAIHVGSRGSAGMMLALFSLGSMLGGLLYTSHSWRTSIGSRYAVVLLGVQLAMAPLVLVDSLPAGVIFGALAGLGIAPMLSCQFSLVGALAPVGSTTEAFTWHRAATVAGIAGGSALGGALIDTRGVGAVFALGCTGAALAVILVILGGRRLEPSQTGSAENSRQPLAAGVAAEHRA